MTTIRAIQDEVCRQFGVSREELLSPTRKRKIAWPRQIAMYLAYERTRYGLPFIATKFGRDHSTVYHGHRETIRRIKELPGHKELVDKIAASLDCDCALG